MLTAHRQRGAGQATPEFIGIVVVVALMLGALAAVMPRTRMPDHPSRVIDVAAAPLSREPEAVPQMPAPEAWDLGDRPTGDPRIDVPLQLTRYRAPLLAGVRRYGGAFADGVRDNVAQRMEDFRRDPLGEARRYAFDAVQPWKPWVQLAKDARNLPGYTQRLMRMTPGDAFETLAHDAGGYVTDKTIQFVLHKGGTAVRARVARRAAGSRRTADPAPETSPAAQRDAGAAPTPDHP